MNAFPPLVLRRTDPAKLEIDWADGHTTIYSAAQLRGVCPCAGCVNEVTGKRMHDPKSVPADMTQADVRMVGNYAIALRFGDGHDTGIFPYRFLRDNDPQLT